MKAQPLERAQLVWERARQPAVFLERSDSWATALDLLRAAHHDPATMLHALALGRAALREDGADEALRHGVETLERAVAFLGVKPRANEIAPSVAPA